MWFVTSMFLKLTQLKPNLTTGLYKYGKEEFGKFTVFLFHEVIGYVNAFLM